MQVKEMIFGKRRLSKNADIEIIKMQHSRILSLKNNEKVFVVVLQEEDDKVVHFVGESEVIIERPHNMAFAFKFKEALPNIFFYKGDLSRSSFSAGVWQVLLYENKSSAYFASKEFLARGYKVTS